MAKDEGSIPGSGDCHPLEEAWQPTGVFLPGGPHGQRSLVGYSQLGHKELDMSKATYAYV